MIRRDSFARCCVVILALSGCVEPQPNPAYEKLTAACNAGDTGACAVILDQQQRQKDAYLASLPKPGSSPAEVYSSVAPKGGYQPAPVQPLTTGQKVCPNGMIVSAYYIC